MSSRLYREGEVPLFTYEHTYNDATSLVSVRKKVTHKLGATEHVKLRIRGQEGDEQQLGQIKGVLRQRGEDSVFEVITSVNTQIPYDGKHVALPRVVATLVLEMVKRDVVEDGAPPQALLIREIKCTNI